MPPKLPPRLPPALPPELPRRNASQGCLPGLSPRLPSKLPPRIASQDCRSGLHARIADCLPGLPPRLTPRIASQDCLQARLLNAKQLFGVDGGHCNLTIRPCHDYVWVSAVGVCCRPSSLPLRRRLCLCINVSASLSLPLSVCLSLSGVSASVCLSIFVCLCLHRCPFLCLTNIRDTFQSPGPPHTHCRQNEGCVQEKERCQTSIWQRPRERSRERPRQRTRQRPCMTGSLRHGISTRAGPQVDRDNGLRGSALYALLLHVSNGSRGLHCVVRFYSRSSVRY